MRRLAATGLPLGCILLLALALRAWGLTWGLPSATHYFSYHTDESVVLEKAMFNMNLFTGHLLPHFYRYGSLQLYLVNFGNSLAFLFNAVDIVPKDFAVWYPQWARMYLIGRLLTVGMGIGTVWATYALGMRLWGRRAGLLSALILAITPLHAQHSHFLTVDVPATLWVVLSLVWTAKLAEAQSLPPLSEEPTPGGKAADPSLKGRVRVSSALSSPFPLGKGHPRDKRGRVRPPDEAGSASRRNTLRLAIWAGVFAGLAAATKYNMALVILPLVLACVLGRQWKPLTFGLVACVLAFLLACPGAILENHQFLAHVNAERIHVSNADDATFKDTGNGFVYHITHNLSAGMGLPLLVLALVAIGYALYRRERGDGLLAAFALPYYVLIGLAAVRYARYVIPLLPILALWTGRLLADLSRLKLVALRRTAAVVAGAVLLFTLGSSLWLIGFMAESDLRDGALRWLNNVAPVPARIGFATQPWFGVPPISPYFPMPGSGAWRSVTSPDVAARIVYSGTDWDAQALQNDRPDFVVLSEYDYDDPLRRHDPAAIQYLQALQRDYRKRITFAHDIPAFANTYDTIRGMPTRNLPTDMVYTHPIIVIYQRR